MSKEHSSPLRYPGGKSFLTDFLAQTIRLNGMEGGIYVEPFAGGAGAALNLLMGEYVGSIHLNDIDPRIHSFWKSILDKTDEFLQLVQDTPLNVKHWCRQRDIAKDPKRHSQLEVGFATFFLNRTNRSGVLNGGPIGGHAQTGNYLIDARYNRKELRRKIEKIALYRDRISVSRKDAVDLLEEYEQLPIWSKNKAIIYLDPPYYEKGKQIYSKFFRDEEHSRLAQFLNKSNNYRWIVSYDDATLIHRLYNGEKNLLFFNYVMHTVRIGRELVIASEDCALPKDFFTVEKSPREIINRLN